MPIDKPALTVKNMDVIHACKRVCQELGIDHFIHECLTGVNAFYQIDMYVDSDEQKSELIHELYKLNIIPH